MNSKVKGKSQKANVQITSFQEAVNKYWRDEGRHTLPWRQTTDPYKILVSEIMLQQTQVERVIPYYKAFLKKYPNVRALAKSNLADVLKLWSGLGYNRRAKLLRDCAQEVVEKYTGKFPKDRALLVALPGIGPYTAGAIRAFAFNEPEIFIETNIRTALLHHFFPRAKKVDDKKMLPILENVSEGQDSREWYSALMDYGAHLKKSGVKLNQKSVHYAKQSKFEGSLRQLRGKLLRRLMDGPITRGTFKKIDAKNAYQISMALQGMEQEGLVVKKKDTWNIA